MILRFILAAAMACLPSLGNTQSIDDNFAGSELDSCKWEDINTSPGRVRQSDGLTISTDGASSFGNSRVLTQYRLTGDFDIQVDYRRVSGFDAVSGGGNPQLSVGLGLYWDEARYISFARQRNTGSEALTVYSSLGSASTAPPFALSSAGAGTLRIVRAGTQVRFLHATAGEWAEIGGLNAPTTPVFAYLSVANVDTARALSASFHNFKVNAGATDNILYTQPQHYAKRPGFALGGVIENWGAFRYLGDSLSNSDALKSFRQAGMEWARVSVTTRTAPELDARPPSQWRTLGWQNHFWGSREYAAATLRDAADRGMRLYSYLYFSDGAANWGNQPAPAAWVGKSVSETAALMEQHAFDVATYFKGKGLDVEIYELGNETDIGMVDFLPNKRIPVPPGVDYLNDRTWLRDNVWSVQATLLKAAARGIRRAAPSARIALHPAGIGVGIGPDFAQDYYRAMRDFGVDYDIAGLSHPYAQGAGAWTLDRYTTACWFRRLARTVDQIAVPGKPVMMVEASYQSDPVGLVSKPMRDFPYTPVGQASWAREQFRFASNHPSMAGWFWFYPEFWTGIANPADETYALNYGSLMSSGTSTRPALEEFRVNLGPVSGNAVEYHHAGFDHYFMTADPSEVVALDGGAFGGVWKRTGQSFMVHANPVIGTVPVCRFFSVSFAPKSSHFYTADPVECEAVRTRNPDWQFEKIAFHVPVPDANGQCQAGMTPIFRMYNNGRGAAPNHRFTTDRATRDAFLSAHGFIAEGIGPLGVAMCSPM